MKCLDSTFIIDLLRNKPKAKQKYDEMDKELVVTTIINLYELMSGVYLTRDKNYEKHIGVLNEFLRNMCILQLSLLSVEKASKINGELSSEGKKIDDLDILTAGICLSNGCDVIVTENVKHFSRIKGLKVEGY